MAKPSAQQGGAARSPCALAATSNPASCNACLTRVTNTFCTNMNKMSTSQVPRTVAVLVACRRPLCTSMQNHVLQRRFQKKATRNTRLLQQSRPGQGSDCSGFRIFRHLSSVWGLSPPPGRLRSVQSKQKVTIKAEPAEPAAPH